MFYTFEGLRESVRSSQGRLLENGDRYGVDGRCMRIHTGTFCWRLMQCKTKLQTRSKFFTRPPSLPSIMPASHAPSQRSIESTRFSTSGRFTMIPTLYNTHETRTTVPETKCQPSHRVRPLDITCRRQSMLFKCEIIGGVKMAILELGFAKLQHVNGHQLRDVGHR